MSMTNLRIINKVLESDLTLWALGLALNLIINLRARPGQDRLGPYYPVPPSQYYQVRPTLGTPPTTPDVTATRVHAAWH